MAMYPNADWGKLLRDAIPGIWGIGKETERFIERLIQLGFSPEVMQDAAQKVWKEVNIPIKVNGVARENKVGPSGCDSCHYVLGHQIEIEKFRLTWTTWILENQTIKFNSCYDFEIHGEELVLKYGEMNLFAGGIIQDPYGNGAYELLKALGETKKLFK